MDWVPLDIVTPTERDAVCLALFHAGYTVRQWAAWPATRSCVTPRPAPPVASFTLAVDRDFKDKNTGERTTDFIDVVAWRSTAEFVSKYFTKGRMAVLEGRLQIRNWTDKDGNKRRSAEVIAEHIYFGDFKREDGCNTYPDDGYAGDASRGNEFAEIGEEDGGTPF